MGRVERCLGDDGSTAPGVPADWAADIAEASKTDLVEPGRVMASVVQDIRATDAERWARRAAALDALV